MAIGVDRALRLLTDAAEANTVFLDLPAKTVAKNGS
jgi:hypothetical protein